MAKPSALTNLNLQIAIFAISTFARIEKGHPGNFDSIFFYSFNLAQLNFIGLYIFLVVRGIKKSYCFLKKG